MQDINFFGRTSPGGRGCRVCVFLQSRSDPRPGLFRHILPVSVSSFRQWVNIDRGPLTIKTQSVCSVKGEVPGWTFVVVRHVR